MHFVVSLALITQLRAQLPLYGSWSSWYECSKTCVESPDEPGSQIRLRECKENCNDENETRVYDTRTCATESPCYTLPVPHCDEWTEWGECRGTTAKCQDPRKTRTQSCVGRLIVTPTLVSESIECELENCVEDVVTDAPAVDYCATFPCANEINTECVSNQNGYQCLCTDGYTIGQDGKCTDCAGGSVPIDNICVQSKTDTSGAVQLGMALFVILPLLLLHLHE